MVIKTVSIEAKANNVDCLAMHILQINVSVTLQKENVKVLPQKTKVPSPTTSNTIDPPSCDAEFVP